MAEKTTTAVDEGEEVDIDKDCQELHKEVSEQMDRLSKMARDSQSDETRKILLEISNTCLGTLRELIAVTGKGFQVVNESLDDLEEGSDAASGSQLTAQDASEYTDVLSQNARVLSDLISGQTGDARKALEALKTLTDDLVKYTKEITLPDEPSGT